MLATMALDAHFDAVIAAVAAAAVAGAAISVWVKTRKRTPEEERERRRREYLTEAGRIIDGTLLAVDSVGSHDAEQARHEDGLRRLYYSYEIAGVIYESSQDVTQMQQFIDAEECRLESAVSVRYDPRNHANSMVVAESWSGLRKSGTRPRALERE